MRATSRETPPLLPALAHSTLSLDRHGPHNACPAAHVSASPVPYSAVATGSAARLQASGGALYAAVPPRHGIVLPPSAAEVLRPSHGQNVPLIYSMTRHLAILIVASCLMTSFGVIRAGRTPTLSRFASPSHARDARHALASGPTFSRFALAATPALAFVSTPLPSPNRVLTLPFTHTAPTCIIIHTASGAAAAATAP